MNKGKMTNAVFNTSDQILSISLNLGASSALDQPVNITSNNLIRSFCLEIKSKVHLCDER